MKIKSPVGWQYVKLILITVRLASVETDYFLSHQYQISWAVVVVIVW